MSECAISLAYVHSIAWNGVGRTLHICNNASELESSPAFHWTCFSLRAYPVFSCMVIRGFDWNEGVSQTVSAPVDCERVGGTSVLRSDVSARRPDFQRGLVLL